MNPIAIIPKLRSSTEKTGFSFCFGSDDEIWKRYINDAPTKTVVMVLADNMTGTNDSSQSGTSTIRMIIGKQDSKQSNTDEALEKSGFDSGEKILTDVMTDLETLLNQLYSDHYTTFNVTNYSTTSFVKWEQLLTGYLVELSVKFKGTIIC